MKTRVALTHKGRFGLCPVYIGKPFSEEPIIVERHWSLLPLFLFSEIMFEVVFWCMGLMGQEPPGWPLYVGPPLDELRYIDGTLE